MTDVEGLQAKLDAAEDCLRNHRAVAAARKLVHDYAAAVDADDLDRVLGLFREDAVLRTPVEVHTGRPAIAEFFRSRLGRPTRHLVVNPRFEISPDGDVEAWADFVALAGGHDCEVTWGAYADRIAVVGDDAWFRARTISIIGVADPPTAAARLVAPVTAR